MSRARIKAAQRPKRKAAMAKSGAGQGAQSFQSAMALHRTGNLADAEAGYRRILRNHPDHPGALQLLGVIASQGGRNEEAVKLIEKSIELNPDNAAAYSQFGDALMELGRIDEAIEAYGDALAIEPKSVEALNNLGLAFKACNRLEDAVAAYGDALNVRPDLPEVHSNMGDALNCLGRFEESVAVCNEALELRPGYAKAHNNFGNALMGLGRVAEAIASYRTALDNNSGYAKAHNNLGNALKEQGSLKEAIASFRRAVTIDPEFAEAFANLGVALLHNGKIDDAMAAQRQALEANPKFAPAHSNLLFTMSYGDKLTAADILAESRLWDARHAAPLLAQAAHGNERVPDRRLRIGYVSPDFRSHAVSYFFEPLMAAHDADRVELFCYAEIANADATTARYQERAEHWRPTMGLSDHEVAERVRADGIDILVDLAGHTAGNRLLAFAEHPAPVQVSHLVGYGQTTGMSAMDYILTDGWMTPAGSDAHYSELPYRLERCFLSFQPLSSWPEVTHSPARDRSYVSFGSLNSPSRITPGTVDAWARILKATEGSRLLMVHGFFRDASIRGRLSAAFEAHGLADRVSFDVVERGWPAGMDIYENLDIALDTFPMASATTTAIALWMGLPVITLAGEAVHTRFGVDILSALGAGGWAAADVDTYVSRAVALAEDANGLADLRAGLRQRMAASPLLDHAGLARAVEAAYRDMWRRWCEGGSIRGRMRAS